MIKEKKKKKKKKKEEEKKRPVVSVGETGKRNSQRPAPRSPKIVCPRCLAALSAPLPVLAQRAGRAGGAARAKRPDVRVPPPVPQRPPPRPSLLTSGKKISKR